MHYAHYGLCGKDEGRQLTSGYGAVHILRQPKTGVPTRVVKADFLKAVGEAVA